MLTLRKQLGSDPLPPSVGMHRQSIEAASPPVPRGDQRPDRGAVVLCDDQRFAVGRQQGQQSLTGVGDVSRPPAASHPAAPHKLSTGSTSCTVAQRIARSDKAETNSSARGTMV